MYTRLAGLQQLALIRGNLNNEIRGGHFCKINLLTKVVLSIVSASNLHVVYDLLIND